MNDEEVDNIDLAREKWKQIPGNENAKSQLEKLLEKDTLPTPLLFSGPKGVGKKSFATFFALTFFHKKGVEGKAFSRHLREFSLKEGQERYLIEEVKEMIDAVSSSPFSGPHKMVLIDQVEKISPVGMSFLLKTLEECPLHTTILLVSSKEETLLPALKSRCFSLSFCPIPDSELMTYLENTYALESREAKRMSLLAQGAFDRAKSLVSIDYKAFFSLIASVGKALLTKDLSSLFKLLEDLELFLKTTSPFSKIEGREEVCLILFYWYRDLELLALQGGTEHLFFFDHQEELLECLSSPRPSLEEVEQKMGKIEKALQLHFKLSQALDFLLV